MQNGRKDLTESKDYGQQEHLAEIYDGLPPIYFDTWRADQLKKKRPAGAHDFRRSKEFKEFVKQLTNVLTAIKSTFLKCQEKEGGALELPFTEEDWKPLDEMAKRLLDPDIVSDVSKGGISEAALMYSEGKRYLEKILYHIDKVPFSRAHAVMASLLKKEKDQTLASLSVCAPVTRHHLQVAMAELSDDIDSEIDEAFLTTIKQFAYQFLNNTPPVTYIGNESHLVATLVNYFYESTGRIPKGHKIMNDTQAPLPGTHLAEGTYRTGFSQEEAARFVKQLKSAPILQGFLERMTIRYHRNLREISSVDGADFFLEKLLKIAGPSGAKKYSLIELHTDFFGHYKIARVPFVGQFVLNEPQKQKIDDYGVQVALSFLQQNNKTNQAQYQAELNELCNALSNYPNIERSTLSKNVLKIYDGLIYELLHITDIKKLDPFQATQDLDILKYLHEQLSLSLSPIEKKAPDLGKGRADQREKVLAAVLFRLNKPAENKTPVIETVEETVGPARFGTVKIKVELDTEDTKELSPRQYCSLDQMVLDDKKSQTETVKKPDDIHKTLQKIILSLLLDGHYIGRLLPGLTITVPIDHHVLHIAPGNLAFSWVSYITETGTEERLFLLDYFNKLSATDQLLFLKKLALLDEKSIPLSALKKIIVDLVPYYKNKDKKPFTKSLLHQYFPGLPFFELSDKESIRTDILVRFALKGDVHAKKLLHARFKTKSIMTASGLSPKDILEIILIKGTENSLLIDLESDFLKDIIWDKSLFSICYSLGKRNFSGTFKNIRFKNDEMTGVSFNGAILENVKFDGFSENALQKIDFKGAKVDQATFKSLHQSGLRCFNHMILDYIDFRNILSEREGCQFRNASLISTNFNGLNLSLCDFQHANLKHALLRNTTFEEHHFIGDEFGGHSWTNWANFSNADLRGADLTRSSGSPIFARTKMDDLSINTYLSYYRQIGRNFRGIEFSRFDVRNEKYNLTEIEFGPSHLDKEQIKKMYAQGIRNFKRLNLYGQQLDHMDLRDADFSGAILESVNFTGSDLSGALCTGAVLENVNFTGSNLRGTVFTDACLSYNGERNLPRLKNTIYDRLDEKDLKPTIAYLAYQGKTPLETLKNLLEQKYLKGGMIYRLFSWRHYVPEVTAMVNHIKHLPPSAETGVQEAFDAIFNLGPKFQSMLLNRGTLYDIYKFSIVSESAFKESSRNLEHGETPDATVRPK